MLFDTRCNRARAASRIDRFLGFVSTVALFVLCFGCHYRVTGRRHPHRLVATAAKNRAASILWSLVGSREVRWKQFASDLKALGYDVGRDPSPGAIVAFNNSAEAVTLMTEAKSRSDYVKPIREWCTAWQQEITTQLEPPQFLWKSRGAIVRCFGDTQREIECTSP